MDAAKVNSSSAVQAMQAPKRTEPVRNDGETARKEQEVQATKANNEQPRPNINGQGQAIGTRFSAVA